MRVPPESDETLVSRLLPSHNGCPEDRARAWADWHRRLGDQAVLNYIRASNNTAEAHADILQEAMLTAYVEVERGRYEHRAGVPFTACVKGIARNKIRAARHRTRNREPLEEVIHPRAEAARELETVNDRREERRAVRRGLAQMPDRRRQMREAILGGESLSEIAWRLEMTEERVRRPVIRAATWRRGWEWRWTWWWPSRMATAARGGAAPAGTGQPVRRASQVTVVQCAAFRRPKANFGPAAFKQSTEGTSQ